MNSYKIPRVSFLFLVASGIISRRNGRLPLANGVLIINKTLVFPRWLLAEEKRREEKTRRPNNV